MHFFTSDFSEIHLHSQTKLASSKPRVTTHALVASSELSEQEARLHSSAMRAANDFKRAEATLMEALIAIEKERIFRKIGYPSLFRYAVECLGLSEAVAYNAIAVARKATEVPALREAVHAGALGLSKATKVVSVLTAGQAPAVQKDWVEKAIELSSRQLEKKVATENPKLCTPERAVYRSAKRLDLRLGIEENILLDFRKAQDRIAISKGRGVSLEETLAEILRFYLERKDPEERARRIIAKKGFGGLGSRQTGKRDPKPEAEQEIAFKQNSEPDRNSEPDQNSEPKYQEFVQSLRLRRSLGSDPDPMFESEQKQKSRCGKDKDSKASFTRKGLFTGRVLKSEALKGEIASQKGKEHGSASWGSRPALQRKPIPTKILHQVRFRDRGVCQYLLPSRKICGSRRWTEIHHRIPVSNGGDDSLENLVTLCRSHHQAVHAR